MNTCRVCNEPKPDDRFELIKASGNRRRVCRECVSEQKRLARENNPEWKRGRAFTLLKWKYGITAEQYEERLFAQGGACAVCKSVVEYLLHVDHDHSCCDSQVTCGECIRGLLCKPCNAAMGMLNDDPARLRRAADYLEGR